MTNAHPRAVTRSIQTALCGAAVGLALFAFWPSRLERPARAIAPSDSRPLASPEPVWRVRLRAIASETDATQRAAGLVRLAEAVPVAQLESAIAALFGEEESTPAGQLGLLLLRRWADHASAAAVDWAGGLSAIGSRTAANVSVGYGLARKNPGEAVTLAEGLPPGQEREGLLHHAVQQWAARDPEAAAAWVERLSDRGRRDEFLTILAVEWASEEPALVATYVSSAVTPGRPRDQAMLQVADLWGRVAPEQAAEWVGNLPASESDVRNIAIGQLAAAWARQDAVKALEWLLRLPDDSALDAGLSSYIGVLAAAAPELAAQLLEEIQDPVVRSAARDQLRSL